MMSIFFPQFCITFISYVNSNNNIPKATDKSGVILAQSYTYYYISFKGTLF